MYAYNDYGFEIVKGAISDQNISNITNELLKIGNNLDKKNDFNNLDDLWNHYSYSNREKVVQYTMVLSIYHQYHLWPILI